jgi:hypothetical protein
MKTFMLLLAFVVTDPNGSELDETVHILSRHFDEKVECETFIKDWENVIRVRGPEAEPDLYVEPDTPFEILKEEVKAKLIN